MRDSLFYLSAVAIWMSPSPLLATNASKQSPELASERDDLLSLCSVPIGQLATLASVTIGNMKSQVEQSALSDDQVLTNDIASVKFEIDKNERAAAKADAEQGALASSKIMLCLYQRRLAQLQGSPLTNGKITRRSDWVAWATDAGCLLILPSRVAKSGLLKSDVYSWQGSPCRPGKFISGAGELIVTTDRRITERKAGKSKNIYSGTLIEGAWNGPVNHRDEYPGTRLQRATTGLKISTWGVT